MKIIILILFLLSCHSKEINHVLYYYENGKPKIIEYNKVFWGDTILVKKQELYINGNIKFQTEFNDKFSKCSSYLESGKIIEEKYFTNGELDSVINYRINDK
tara:strand:- start:9 stop:314 length:306 start_codon:yes stop_codon:yes gene_type:complete